ncbi:MAG: GntR family transcriptional regulator [Pseudoclavibacter sp.]|nr:GntR family transcriptional regulator [Pseudoclavibacter sp.]
MEELAVAGAAPSKAQRAYEHIRDRIASGAYAPGARLVLDQIARELEVSPVPVREAVRRLEAEGLVGYERNIGPHVALADGELYASTMETLGLVEGYATAISAPLLGPQELDRAREVNEQMRTALRDFDPARFTRLNQRFHEVLFTPCPNEHVLELVHRGWRRLASMRESSFGFAPGRAAESVEEHERILRLVASGADAQEIELAAREHRLNTLRAVQAAASAPAHAPAPPPEEAAARPAPHRRRADPRPTTEGDTT